MNDIRDFRLGIMFRREHPPETLPAFARRAEEAGFAELWVVEDCFYGSGIASAAIALASTQRIQVGLGIMPAVVRNPVFAAMEIATLARLYPGRFLGGLGHGMAGWMRQIGAFPPSQLIALEEATIAIRRLLAGERLTLRGRHFQIEDAELLFPPEVVPPIFLGVRGSKSLTLAGRVADGAILAEYAAPAYISWAQERIEIGRMEAGSRSERRLTVFAFSCAGSTREAAQKRVRPYLAEAIASGHINAQLAPLGILPQIAEMQRALEPEEMTDAIPGDWIEKCTIAGRPSDWDRAIQDIVAAGADTVVLVPLPDKGPDEVDVFRHHLDQIHAPSQP